MQPKTSVGIALALLARDVHGDAREALLATLASELRDAVESLVTHIESAPTGSAERAARMKALLPKPTWLRAWPSDVRVAALLAGHVDPLLPKPAVLPLPRRRYRVPKGLRESLRHRAEGASKDMPWPA